MFSLIRKRTTTPTGINPKNRLTKKQKQKLLQNTQQLQSDIKKLTFKLDSLKTSYQTIERSFEHAEEDLKKIEYSISKKWYEACTEICLSNGWNAYSTFREATRRYREFEDRRANECDDLCAKAIVEIERQLREGKRQQKKLLLEISAIERKISTTQSELNTLQKI